jgi:hypothetical protein
MQYQWKAVSSLLGSILSRSDGLAVEIVLAQFWWSSKSWGNVGQLGDGLFVIWLFVVVEVTVDSSKGCSPS